MMQNIVKAKQDAKTWNQRLSSSEYTERRISYNSKYTGVMIKDLPTDYIKWAILNLPNHGWNEYFARELQRRDRSFK